MRYKYISLVIDCSTYFLFLLRLSPLEMSADKYDGTGIVKSHGGAVYADNSYLCSICGRNLKKM